MVELLTILAIGLALECLLGWVFKPVDKWADSRREWEERHVVESEFVNECLVCNAKPGEECKDDCPVGCRVYKPMRFSPIMSIQEILPRYSGQRDFRVIADVSVSPIEMEPYLPFAYGDSLPDDPSGIATSVSYHREHQTETHAVWHASYKFTLTRERLSPIDFCYAVLDYPEADFTPLFRNSP